LFPLLDPEASGRFRISKQQGQAQEFQALLGDGRSSSSFGLIRKSAPERGHLIANAPADLLGRSTNAAETLPGEWRTIPPRPLVPSQPKDFLHVRKMVVRAKKQK